MTDASWTYVGLAYGVTYFVLIGYAVYLIRRRTRAREALQAELHREA
ncbi:MAG TPA: heme exporter protein CcmD [Longimicrobiales bacterium]